MADINADTNTGKTSNACPATHVLTTITARADDFEGVRMALLEEALQSAPFDGWTPLMLTRAAKAANISPAQTALAFPDGVIDLIDYWAECSDKAMLEAMIGDDFRALKIRDKVTLAVRTRLEGLGPHHEAARRVAATLALPLYAPHALRLTWRTADRIWRGLGDRSTDFNYYSKRTILAGVWTSSFAKWLADDSADHGATWAFLDKRIANVMAIEKAKARWRKADIDPGKLIREGVIPALSKLRYPSFRR